MTDEKEESKPSFLDEVRVERMAFEKVRDENKAILEDMKKLRAEDIMSGKAKQPNTETKPEDPRDYLKRMTGIDVSKR